MTTNPFARRNDQPVSVSYGDNQVFHARNESKEIIKTFTLRRTERPYVHDLADAYNDAMPDQQRNMGIVWYVTPAGELKIGEDSRYCVHQSKVLEHNREQERQRWLRNYRQADA